MLSGEFERKLQKLNKNLRVCCGDNPNRPAGLYYIQCGEYIQVCGVDKNWVGENIEYDYKGHIIKSGWKRVLKILASRKLIDKQYANRVFNTDLSVKIMSNTEIICDPILNMIQQAKIRGYHVEDGEVKPVYGQDDMADIGKEIRKSRPDGIPIPEGIKVR
jgi:hypothetical protein